MKPKVFIPKIKTKQKEKKKSTQKNKKKKNQKELKTVRLTHDSQCISSLSSPGPQFFVPSHFNFSAIQNPDILH